MVMRLGGLLATAALLALASNGSGCGQRGHGARRSGPARSGSQRRGQLAHLWPDLCRATLFRARARQRRQRRPARRSPGRSELDTDRGQEATPIVVDGVMYTSTAWSKVMALDAATGKVLWRSIRTTRLARARMPAATSSTAASRCGRAGLCRHHRWAADRARRRTGAKVWDVVTVDQRKPYTITGAPRVVRGKVIIGNSGAELGVRGYVTAYDAADRQAGVALLHRAGQPGRWTRRRGFETRPSRRLAGRPGTASGGSWAAAARSGTRWSTTRSSTSC